MIEGVNLISGLDFFWYKLLELLLVDFDLRIFIMLFGFKDKKVKF